MEVKLEGLDDVMGRLDSISHDVRYKGGRFALRKAAQLVARAAADGAAKLDDPASAAEISKNIVDGNKYPGLRFSTRAFKASGDIKFRVGVAGGAGGNLSEKKREVGLPGGDTRHWRLLEFGTERSRAQPFMRRALSSNINAAIAEFAKHFEPAMDRAIKRAKKRT